MMRLHMYFDERERDDLYISLKFEFKWMKYMYISSAYECQLSKFETINCIIDSDHYTAHNSKNFT